MDLQPAIQAIGRIQALRIEAKESREKRKGNTRAGLKYSQTSRFLVLLLTRPAEKNVRFFFELSLSFEILLLCTFIIYIYKYINI